MNHELNDARIVARTINNRLLAAEVHIVEQDDGSGLRCSVELYDKIGNDEPQLHRVLKNNLTPKEARLYLDGFNQALYFKSIGY